MQAIILRIPGSAPLKLCRAGEVAIGFGLRHQAVADKANGQPIDYVDPTEGNFSLTELGCSHRQGQGYQSAGTEDGTVHYRAWT